MKQFTKTKYNLVVKELQYTHNRIPTTVYF